jgi:tetratricopeptide (TPR) repeat protein
MGPAWVVAVILAVTPASWGSQVFRPDMQALGEADTVLTARLESGSTVLPVESLAFYREGLEARDRGDTRLAESSFRLAGELDPSFVETQLALARLSLFHDPRASLERLGAAFQAATGSFRAQHLTLVNLVFGILVFCAVFIVVLTGYAGIRHLPRVHHSLLEYLKLWFYGPLAGILALALLATPVLWQLGLLPLAFTFLGLMWCWMKRAERRWVSVLGGLLVAGPLLVWGLSPLLLSPLDPAQPSFLISRAMTSSYSSGLTTALEAAAKERPENPDVQFALGVMYKRAGRYGAAEAAYARAMELGADEAAVRNNLGVISFLRGNYDTAMDQLRSSIDEDPDRAASHFNLSQTYAKKLYFDRAEEELQRANALSFNRIRATLRYSEGDNRRTLIDEPLPDAVFWKEAWAGARRMPGTPSWLRTWFPGSLWFLGPVCLFCFAAAFVLGRRLHRTLPSFDCMNCGRPVCRRCLRRIRRATYCTPCGDALLRIQSSSYTKLVLDSRIRRKRRFAYLLARITSLILPGFHAARLGRTNLAAVLACVTTAAVLCLARPGPPLARLVWLDSGNRPWWPEFPIFLLALAVITSVITVVRLRPPSVIKPHMEARRAEADEPEPEEHVRVA